MINQYFRTTLHTTTWRAECGLNDIGRGIATPKPISEDTYSLTALNDWLDDWMVISMGLEVTGIPPSESLPTL